MSEQADHEAMSVLRAYAMEIVASIDRNRGLLPFEASASVERKAPRMLEIAAEVSRRWQDAGKAP